MSGISAAPPQFLFVKLQVRLCMLRGYKRDAPRHTVSSEDKYGGPCFLRVAGWLYYLSCIVGLVHAGLSEETPS